MLGSILCLHKTMLKKCILHFFLTSRKNVKKRHITTRVNGYSSLVPCGSLCNSVGDFSCQDWQLIVDTWDEFMRNGNFRRLYPPSDSKLLEYYERFFSVARYSNIVISKWIKAGAEKVFTGSCRRLLNVPDFVPKQVFFDPI